MGKEFYGAVATLVGTIVGVGAFGLPYVVAKSGFLIGLIFLFIISGVVLLLHLFYGEIVLRTPGKHRFVGYAEIYLGRWGKRLTTFTATIIIYGALLAYIIVGGKFLSTIFGRSEFFWSLIFFVVCAGAIFLGLKVVTKIEIFMSFFLIGIVFLIFVKGWPSINFDNLTNLNWAYFFLPYGVVLWAVGGWAAIPEMKEIFKQKYQFLKKAIIWGTLLPPLLYIIFIFTVVGVTGSATSSEGIIGLAAALKNNVIILPHDFRYDHVILEYLSSPQKDSDYQIPISDQEALIAFIEWKLKYIPAQVYYGELKKARRRKPGKRVTMQNVNQVVREANGMKLRV